MKGRVPFGGQLRDFLSIAGLVLPRESCDAGLQRAGEALDLLFRLVLGDAVDFLDAAGEFFAAAVDHVKVVVRELAPLLADLAGKLFPIPFDTIPVHVLSP